MKYHVFITEDAEQDLYEIFIYIYNNDSPSNADYVYKKIKQVILSLAECPKRGHIPPELERINIYEYHELHFKPYRILYSVENENVFINCILDGRRDLSEILAKRLTR
jgi:toxin ParE1/3/4